MIDIAEETLGFRHPEFSSGDPLLMPAFSLPTTPANLTIYLRCCRDAPLPLVQSTRSSKLQIPSIPKIFNIQFSN